MDCPNPFRPGQHNPELSQPALRGLSLEKVAYDWPMVTSPRVPSAKLFLEAPDPGLVPHCFRLSAA